MTAIYEYDDKGLHVIGYNQGIFFHSPDRTLRQQIYLQTDNTLNIQSFSITIDDLPRSIVEQTSGISQSDADARYVQLDGSNQALWIPNPAPGDTIQDITGSFNLAGASYAYLINGKNAVNIAGTGNFLGGEAVNSGGSSSNSVAIGESAAHSVTMTDSVVVGEAAGYQVGTILDAAVIVGAGCASGGADSLLSVVGIGYRALWGASLTSSVGIGDDALGADATGAGLVYIGSEAGEGQTGDNNVGLGYRAMDGGVSGDYNVSVGYYAGRVIGAGSYNTLVGAYAGEGNSGDDNTFIGYGAGDGADDGSGNVFIGVLAGKGLTVGSNKLIIANSDTTTPLIGGDFVNARAGVNMAPGSLAAAFHIDQPAADGAEPVLILDQADVSEEFIRFIGTAAASTLTQSIVAVADVSTATVAGYVRVYVVDTGDQITDQAYYMPIYTLA